VSDDGLTLHVGLKELLRALPWILSLLLGGLGLKHGQAVQTQTEDLNALGLEQRIEILERREVKLERKLARVGKSKEGRNGH
jgi:hypothetical protein